MGWLDNLQDGGQFDGLTNKGFNYNGAWGGPAQNGGSIPGSVGFSYARTGAPSNGKYAKKTLPSAQDGFSTEYDPDKNPTWKGDSERVVRKRLENAQASNTQRAIEQNQKKLADITAFNLSKQNYIDQKKAIVNNYTTVESDIKGLGETVQNKYNFDLTQEKFAQLSPRQMIARKMIERANAVTASGTGYPLTTDLGEEGNKLTCLHGVCKAATEAGVSFDALAGEEGVRRDEKDPNSKYTVDYNPTWVKNDNYKKVGYERVPVGELPQEGDLAQYEVARDNSHSDVEHMEFVKKLTPTGYESFNNYNQTNYPTPGTGNSIRTFEPGDSKKIKEFGDTFYFRLREDAANKIVHTDPQYKPIVEGYSKYKDSEEAKLINEKRALLEQQKAEYEKAQEFFKKQEALTKKRGGGVIKDDNGYWNPDNWGKVVEVGSNSITMKGVNEPLLGVSDTGDVKYMEPGEGYVFDGSKVTEYPIAQNGSKLFFDQYSSSPNYKERLEKQGYIDPDKVIMDRKNHLSKTKLNVIPDTGGFTPKNTGSFYRPETNTVDYDEFDLQLYPGSTREDIVTHETSHALGSLKPNKSNLTLNRKETEAINSRNKSKQQHEENPWEAKADMDVLRYHLKKDKIYDTGTQDFTPELLKKAKQKYKGNETIKRFFNRFSDKDAVYLMNNIALANNDEASFSAKNGGSLTELDQLTNFTNYNKPQKGGWLDKL